MIQRVQTLYLLAAAAAFALQFLLPYASAPVTTMTAYADGQLTPQDNFGLLGLDLLGIGLTAIAVFLFKNRPMQGRLAALGSLVAVLLAVLVAVVFFAVKSSLPAETSVSYGFGAVLPILAGAFAILASRAIRNDENLIRSADRLR